MNSQSQTAKMAPAKPQKHRLTIDQLAAYDDILTDALVDHTYYWTTVPKNKQGYHASRGLKEEEVAKIIQNHIIVNKDVAAAEEHLLALPGLRSFLNRLRTANEKEDFKKHLRRYTNIYLPDCPFEVTSTNRYTITTHEAAISARRLIKKGEQIKYLSGIQVVLTPEEEQDIMERKKDFSIVISSRHKHTSLFMGPARFANHDCDANARLVTCGHAGIEIVAERDIEADEEITVTYSENYFGEDNCECLCKTCEANLANGWTNPDLEPVKSIEEDLTRGYSLRRRRRGDSIGPISRTPSVAPEIRPKIRKSRSKALLAGTERGSTADTTAPEALLRQKRKREVDSSLASPPITPPKKQKTGRSGYAVVQVVAPSEVSRGSSVDSSQKSMDGEQSDTVMTDATSPEDECPEPLLGTPDPSPVKAIASQIKREDSDISVTDIAVATPRADKPIQSIESPIALVVPVAQVLETPAADASGDPAAEGPTPATSNRKCGRLPARSEVNADSEGEDASPEPPKRIPGDYTLTPVLLSTPESAWVTCTVCIHAFVQYDAYFTRRECPRCERHSKLYGYMWPKTDKYSKDDTEERVLDHRTVHRFLDAEDERKVRGKERADYKKLHAEWEKEENDGSPKKKAAGWPKGKPRPKGKSKETPSKKVQDDEEYIVTTTRSGRASRRMLRS